MSQCQNRIGERCKLDGNVCPHLVYDGKCEYAKVSEIGKATFEQALKVITKFSRPTKVGYYIHSFKTVILNAGLEMSDTCDSLTYDRAERYAKMVADKYQPSTAKNMLQAVYRCACNNFRAEYKAMGVSKPVFDRYTIEVPKKKIPTLTWKQKKEIIYHMETLRRIALDENEGSRKRRNARNEFIVLWWGRWFGVRTTDAIMMKWRNILSFNGIPHVNYLPRKTRHLNVEDTWWPICEDAYNEIMPFIGNPDDDCIYVKWSGERKVSHGLCAGMHRPIIQRINKWFRKIGCNGWAAYYNLRYWQSQSTYDSEGPEAEAKKLHHSIHVAQKHYYNKNDHRMRI